MDDIRITENLDECQHPGCCERATHTAFDLKKPPRFGVGRVLLCKKHSTAAGARSAFKFWGKRVWGLDPVPPVTRG